MILNLRSRIPLIGLMLLGIFILTVWSLPSQGQNGIHLTTSQPNTTIFKWLDGTISFVNFELHVTAIPKTDGPMGYGIILGASADDFYFFEVRTDGTYKIWQRKDDQWVDQPNSVKAHPAIIQREKPNSLAIEVYRDEVDFVVNGQRLERIHITPGVFRIGVGIHHFSNINSQVEARFDSIQVHSLSSAGQSACQVSLNALWPNPQWAAQPAFEWVQLRNSCPFSVHIGGWTITDQEGAYTFPQGTVLEPDTGTLKVWGFTYNPDSESTGFVLDNDGDRVLLFYPEYDSLGNLTEKLLSACDYDNAEANKIQTC